MKRRLFSFLFLVQFASIEAQITKIEHFNAHTTQASALYQLFKSTFKLPVVYDYQNYGSFSSGGLWLGNITLEFVDYTGNPYTQAIFKGVALEPLKTTDSIVAMLDKSEIAHAMPVPTKFKVDGAEKTFWTNTVLKDLSSTDVRVFVCDYQDRSFVNTPKAVANDSLMAIHGGPLGILGLKTIVFGVVDIEKATAVWSKIPGIKSVASNTFQFSEGPEALLKKTEKDGIIEIMVRIRSKEAALQYLEKSQLLKKEGASILIDPVQINGLRIFLEEN